MSQVYGHGRYIGPIIGIVMVSLVFLNVQFGLIAPEIIDGSGPAKIDAMKMLEPHCAISEIELELSQGGDSFVWGQ